MFVEYRGLRKELYILFIGRMMTNMGSMIWPMFTLILNKKLGFDASTIAKYILLYGIVALPISLIGGKLADKYNKRNIIIVCDIISICAYIYCSMVELTISSMLIFAGAALFQSVEHPSYEALVADFTTSEDRMRAYSLSYLGLNLGLVLSPSIAGILFNNHLNLAFLISGLAIMSSTILIAIFIKDVHREEDNGVASVYEKDVDEKTSTIKLILDNRVVLIFLIAGICSNAVYNMWNYMMPLDMGLVHGDNGSVFYGTMTSLNCIMVVSFTALITKLLSKRTDIFKMFSGEVLILSGFLIFTLFMKYPVMCYVSIFVFTFGEIFCTLAYSPFLTRRIPGSHRGRIISVQNVSHTIGLSLFQLLIGRIYDNMGSVSAWTLTLALGVVVLILFLIMGKMDRIDYKDLY